MTCPVLETPRLSLRPMGLGDLGAALALEREALAELGAVDLIGAGQVGAARDPAALEGLVRARIKGPYPRGMGAWAVATKNRPAAVLGWVMLAPEVEGPKVGGPEIAVGWRMGAAARGQGYAPEAGARAITYGFADLEIDRIVFEVHRENLPSRRVAEKIGMRLEADPAAPGSPSVRYVTEIHCRR